MTIGLIWIAAGVIIGLVAAGAIGVAVMRSQMVVRARSAHSFDDTCARIERVVDEAEGWGFPRPAFDLPAKLAEKGALPANIKRVQQHSVCSPPVATRVLADDSVWIARMNVAMLSKVMGGAVGTAMQVVARADDTFMAKILK